MSEIFANQITDQWATMAVQTILGPDIAIMQLISPVLTHKFLVKAKKTIHEIAADIDSVDEFDVFYSNVNHQLLQLKQEVQKKLLSNAFLQNNIHKIKL